MADKEEKLNERQEKFCKIFTSPDKELFGNGVQAYLEVYNIDTSKPNWYKTACAAASRLLSNAKVYNRIQQLLEEGGLNLGNVDKQLLFLINQYSDFKTKLGAIKEFNALKQRITEKIEHSFPEPLLNGKSNANTNNDSDKQAPKAKKED